MKHDLNVPRNLEPVEKRLRATLAAVAATTPTPADGDTFNVVALPLAPARDHARRWAVGLAAAAAVAIGATVTVAGVGPSPTTNVATQDDQAQTSTLREAAVGYLLPDVPPDGFQEGFVGRSGSPVRAKTQMEVYADGGDPLADRALVVLRSTEPAALNTVLSFDGGSRDTIDGQQVTYAAAGVLRGFDLEASRRGVAVIGRGLDDAELRAAARVVLADGHVARAVPDRLTLVYEGRHPLIEAPSDDVVFNNYATPDGLRELELRTVTGGAAPIAALAWQLDGTRDEIALRGTRGVIVTIVDRDTGSAYRQLLWSEGDVAVTVGGRRVSDDELLGFARSLRPATRAELDTLIARSEASYSED